jgi:hypothetical protein
MTLTTQGTCRTIRSCSGSDSTRNLFFFDFLVHLKISPEFLRVFILRLRVLTSCTSIGRTTLQTRKTKKLQLNSHGLSSLANYTDRATAACRRSDCQLLRIEGATWSAWRIPTAVFSVLLTGAATFLSSSSSVILTRLSGPCSRPTTFFLVVPGIEPGPPDL